MGIKNKTLNIGIVGLGLIGGSFGRAFIKKTGHRVFGCDRDADAVYAAMLAGAISGELTPATLPALDLIIFAVNPRTTVKILEDYLPYLKGGCIVTDAGGLKRNVISVMRGASERYPGLQFIGAHPMAGKEFSGFSHSSAELFEGASALMVSVNAPPETVRELKQIFSALGFKNCKDTSAEHHDKLIAYTSQLCHAISSSYCLNPLSGEHDGFSAGSFRDLTRVARLSASMWTELMCDNADNLSVILDEFIAQISALKSAVERRDEEEIYKILSAGNEKKEQMDRAKDGNSALIKEPG